MLTGCPAGFLVLPEWVGDSSKPPGCAVYRASRCTSGRWQTKSTYNDHDPARRAQLSYVGRSNCAERADSRAPKADDENSVEMSLGTVLAHGCIWIRYTCGCRGAFLDRHSTDRVPSFHLRRWGGSRRIYSSVNNCVVSILGDERLGLVQACMATGKLGPPLFGIFTTAPPIQ